jgi:predicted sulfurtransferase
VEPRLLVIAVYRFIRLGDLPERRARIREACRAWGLKGTVLLAPEGVNAFISGTPEAIGRFKNLLAEETGLSDLVYKESWSATPPFERMLVKLKREIISLGDPAVRPEERTAPAISPAELKGWLDEGRDVVLVDTRNGYEIDSGTFRGAEHLEVDSFREFGKKFRAQAGELRQKWGDRPVVMFCTGGIRCEKASVLMMDEGFRDVRQLDGGILNYFEKVGGEHYDGDCFVFDWRLAVDEKLSPTSRKGEVGRHKVDALD